MNTLLYPISFVFIFLLFVTKVIPEGYPGTYICYYFGDVANVCGGKPLDVCELPPECTSFAYDGLVIDEMDVNSSDCIIPISGVAFPFLDAILTTDKPVYVSVYHDESDNWRYDCDPIDEKAKLDSEYIQNFLTKHPKLQGLIFSDIDLPLYQQGFTQFGTTFQKYLHYLRKTTCNFTIGVSISATSVIDLVLATNQSTGQVDPDPIVKFKNAKGDVLDNLDCLFNVSHNTKDPLDFSLFDCEVDFYVFTFSIFNHCSPKYVDGGTIPMTGTEPHTLEKLKQAIDKLNIADKNKIYFKFQLFAISDKSRKLTYKNECYSTYGKICGHPNETCNWCADNSSTLREKGCFAKENGGGFVVDSIDINDPCQECECKTSFPSFYYLVDGFTGQHNQPDCPKFDRMDSA